MKNELKRIPKYWKRLSYNSMPTHDLQKKALEIVFIRNFNVHHQSSKGMGQFEMRA